MIVNEEAVKKILEEVKPAKLVAATKYVDVKEIEKLEKLGVTCFGENRVQAFLEKYENYHGNGEFQFIGTLQPNKVKYIIDKVSMVRTDVAWATAYPYRYVVLEGDPKVIAQYEAIAKQHAAYTAQIDKYNRLLDFESGEVKRFISHPDSYYIIDSIEEEPLNLPKRSFIEWLRFAPRKETKRVVNDTYNSTENHRLYVFVDDGNTKRPHFVELLISNDGTRAVFYQSK